jgi:hypothetical protein
MVQKTKFVAGEASIYCMFPRFEGMQHLHLHGQAAPWTEDEGIMIHRNIRTY